MQSLTVAVACDDPTCKCRHATREVVVIECRKLGEKRYQTTVLFVDATGDPTEDLEDLLHIPA